MGQEKGGNRARAGYAMLCRGGINRQNIFEDEEDYDKFKQVLAESKEKSRFKLYACCLMANHVHLLINPCILKGRADIIKAPHRAQCKPPFRTSNQKRGTGVLSTA